MPKSIFYADHWQSECPFDERHAENAEPRRVVKADISLNVRMGTNGTSPPMSAICGKRTSEEPC
jgi:hypothetical protein